MKKEFGKHYIIELLDCDSEIISSVPDVERVMLAAANESNSTILSHSFHQFDPSGVSGFIFIAESHFAVHTWPEDGYASADIFTCGETMNPEVAVEVMKRDFGASEVALKILSRGIDMDV